MKKNTLALTTALALGSVLSVAYANEAAQSSVEQVTRKPSRIQPHKKWMLSMTTLVQK